MRALEYHRFCHEEMHTMNEWGNIKRRCYGEKHPDFRRIGGRGIKVCDQWLEDFVQFFDDVGKRPTHHILQRIDDTKDYEPGNVEWMPKSKAKVYSNVNEWIINGVTYPTAAKAADALGVDTITVRRRVKAGTPGYQKICTEPPMRYHKYWWYAEGIKYRTAQEAADALGVTLKTIQHRIREESPGYYKTNLLNEVVPVKPPKQVSQKYRWIAEGVEYRTLNAVAEAYGLTPLGMMHRFDNGKKGYVKLTMSGEIIKPKNYKGMWFLD